MSFEIRTQTVEPRRAAFTHLVERFGDKAATRYQEGTYNVQATEHFHYRPYWDPDHETYDPDHSALKLTDPYAYSDPRQFFYATWVAARSQHYEAFGKTLTYVEDRGLLARMPDNWRDLLIQTVLPLRHYESGAQLISSNGCRFAYGTTVSQAAGFASMDRIGNAQLLSTIGLALAGGGAENLARAKQAWIEGPALQPTREFIEQAMIAEDWAEGMLAVEIFDSLLYALVYRQLDDRALANGATAYSLLAQHFSNWYADHQRWLDALVAAWVADAEHGEANRAVLGEVVVRWFPQALAAVRTLAAGMEADHGSTTSVAGTDAAGADLLAKFDKVGVPTPAVAERVSA